MPNPYEEGNLAWFWYQSWLPVVTAVGTLAVLVYVFSYSIEGIRGTVAKVVGSIAFLGTLPMSQERIGIGVNVVEESMFILNILGFVVAIAIAYFHYSYRKLALADSSGMISDPSDGAGDTESDSTEGISATMTQVVEDADVTPPDGTLVADPAATAVPGLDPLQPQAFLLIKSGPQAGTSVPITQAQTSIGRSSDADIVLDDEQVSRMHANITYADGQFTMVDAGSSGGTIVDGVAGETIVLKPGSELKLGNTEMVFMQGQSTIVGSPPGAPTQAPGAAEPGATIIAAPEPDLLMKWLAITDGPGKGMTVQLKAGRTTIGREQTNDIQISDASVSREHAAILSDGDELKIVDLGSTAGTTVAGQPVSGGKVGPGDVISIGQNKMSLVPVDAQVESTPATAGASDKTMVMGPQSEGVSAVLVVQSGPDAGKSFQLTEGDNLLGRDPASQVLLTDQSVSRRHAILRKRDEAYAIYDLGSSGGTSVNGIAMEGTTITAGQEIKFGNSTAVIMDPTASK